MIYEHIQESTLSRGDEIILGLASWSITELAIKYAWRDRLGRRSRGGEVPVRALKQMVAFAIQHNYVKPEEILDGVAEGLRARP